MFLCVCDVGSLLACASNKECGNEHLYAGSLSLVRQNSMTMNPINTRVMTINVNIHNRHLLTTPEHIKPMYMDKVDFGKAGTL